MSRKKQLNIIYNKKSYFSPDLYYMLNVFAISTLLTSLPLIGFCLYDFFNGSNTDVIISDFFGRRDVFIVLVSILSSSALVKSASIKKKWYHKISRSICWTMMILSLCCYWIVKQIKDVGRSWKWFFGCVLLSLINIIFSQYIPKTRSKKHD